MHHDDARPDGNRCRRVTPAGVALLALALAAPPAHAAICKYVDSEGNIHYSNVAPEKGMRRISCDAGSEESPAAPRRPATGSAPASQPATKPASPPGFPRIDAETQKGRDDMRRKVLGDELAAEEKLLAESRAAYANGAPPPQGDEQSNPQKYAERIAKLRQSVQLHERNVEALRKELGTQR